MSSVNSGEGGVWSPTKAFADKALQNSLNSKVDKREFNEIIDKKADKI